MLKIFLKVKYGDWSLIETATTATSHEFHKSHV